MRAEDDLTYQEYKEGVEDAMRYIKNHGWTPRQVTDRMTDEDNELLIGTSEALWIISIGAYEVEHVAKNNMTEEKTVETTVQESSSETISDDTKTTETAQYAMERSETESTKESESIQDITETYEDMSEYAIVEPETEGDLTSKQKNAVNMLNYIMTITQEINNSKESRLYLESAYSSLINNSDPGLIDTRTQERITNILDTLEQYRMIAEKRERLRYIYEQNRAQALRQAIPDPVGLLSAVSSGNILKSAASVIYMAVDAASSYQNAVTQTDLQYLQDGWQLEDEEAQELHNSRKSTFEYMVDMVRENSLPGEYALNENAVNDFVEWKDKTNLTSKIQWLESNESTYEKFGPFWLELAKSYYKSEEYDKCLDAIKKYEGISVKIFRKDYDYAEALPMAIVSAKEIRDKNVYIQTAREYSEVILSNADGENWALRYFVAQIYLDLYKQTGSKEYLQKAYDIALNNVNVLVESQKELNLAYLSDIQEVSVNKEAEDEDREKKEVKQYNKLLKAQRKVELPPVDEALYLNCDLLFALAEQLDISVDEQKKIDAILHENGEPVFLTQALDEKFWFESAYKKLDVQNIDIDFDGKTLKIPAVCIADRSRITVSVDGSSGNQTFQDWTVKKVYRPKGADCSDFIVIFTSETAKKYKYESGDKIAVQITPVAESADEILEYDYKATVIQKAFAFKTISFERAAK